MRAVFNGKKGTLMKSSVNRMKMNLIERFSFCLLLAFLVLLHFGVSSGFADVTLDNGDPGTSYTGTWRVSGGTEPYGDDSLWSRDGATYTWEFDSQPSGVYEVLMWWSALPSRGTEIDVDINYSGGNETVIINQQENAGQWNSLGTYYFDTNGSVTITAAYGSNISTCADAVWFKFISDNSPPIAYIDSITPNPAELGQLIEFSGHGTDKEGSVVAYQWESSIDGSLSDVASFTTSTLTEGTHTISFKVQDDEGLWSEVVTETLIVGSIPTEVIIDNRDPETSQTGTWGVSGGPDPYGEDSVWSRDGSTFSWHFNPPQTGDYEVSMWWSEYPSRSTSVPVTVNHSGDSITVYVDQTQEGGQWNSLGQYHFESGSSYDITITAQPGPSSTCADAVKLNFVQTNSPPTAIIDSITPNPADVGAMVSFTGRGEDPDGYIVAYSWESSIAGQLSEEPSFSTDSLSEGVHSITFKVQDNEGEWSNTASETLTIGNPPNVPPTATIDSITPNPANLGEIVSFTGHGEDSDGSIVGYRWESSIDSVLSYTDFFTTSSLSEGTHTITFTVYDDDDAASEPVTQVLTVEDIPIEVEIDNGGSNTSYTGTWGVSGGPNPYGTGSLWSRDGATYTWTFSPTVSFYYEVFMWWTEYPSRSANVPVDIEYLDGISTVYINQQENGGQWNSLGIYYFEAGSNYRVTITAQPGPSSTCADAVKFVKTTDPGTNPPVANFSADKTSGGVPCTVQFYDQSMGSVSEWLWDFGDGQTSIEQNPSHEYAAEGTYTVSLTVTNPYGSDTKTVEHYIQVFAALENVYLCDGYSKNALFIPRCIEYIEGIGAVENGGMWIYENPSKGVTYHIYTVHSPEAMEQALKDEGAHIIFNGHSNFGFGASFGTSKEIQNQQIDNIFFVDDDRFANYSTDMVSTKVDGMKYGQAYPNWEPVFKDGTNAIMPYDFTEGIPPYNYYLTYTIPGDSTTYKVELSDGSFLERFPDSNTPAWFSTDGSLPDPVENAEYFITNPDSEFSHCDFVGEWPIAKIPGAGYMGDAGYLGYNYQYHYPGSGANTATFTLLVRFPGYYAVLASWFPSPENATNAKFTINHAYGSDSVEVDQRETELMNSLGVYYFDEGACTIELTDDADGTVIADAVILMSLEDPEAILQAEFNADMISGAAPLSVQFKDLSSVYIDGDFEAEITNWHWDFGDGTTSNEQNPTHTYSEPGIYSVSLTVTDSSGAEQTEFKEGFIVVETAAPLHAEFTAPERMSSEKTVVKFVDQSSGEITEWLWDFGDGTTSNEQNPMHVYITPGSYTVTLTVYGPEGSASETEVDFIYNIVGTIYVDNTFHTKPHFYSGSMIKFGKVICNTGSVKIPFEEMKFSRMFYGGCNSSNYYVGAFHRGIFFFLTADSSEITGAEYLRRYLLGDNDDEILAILNSIENKHEYYNFDLKPPSMR
jgi:PKD repeat protein